MKSFMQLLYLSSECLYSVASNSHCRVTIFAGFLCCRTPLRKIGQMPSIIFTIFSNIFSTRATPLNIHPSPANGTTSSNASLPFTRFFPGVLSSNHITQHKSLHSYVITFAGACYMRVAEKRKILRTTCYGAFDSTKSSLYTNNSFLVR